MLVSYKLPLAFDAERLKIDLNRIQPGEWVLHFNTAYYQGEWSGVSLRSVGGHASQLYSDPTAQGKSLDSQILARCPYFEQVLAEFECPLETVRLLKLAAGSSIREHRDYHIGYDYGTIRMHVPISTGTRIAFIVNGQHIDMHEGECWYADFSLPHCVDNHGDADRVHMVIDCLVNDWVRSVIPFERDSVLQSGDPSFCDPSSYAMPKKLIEFRQMVLGNPLLQEKLREANDPNLFLSLVMQLARECHYDFTRQDVEHALRIGRLDWFKRWI